MATFTYDGERFEFVEHVDRIPVGRLDQLEQHYGGGKDFNVIIKDATRLRRMVILIWASIVAKRPAFSLAEAEALDLGELNGISVQGKQEKPPEQLSPDEVAMLPPTSAGSSRTPRKAARSSAGGAATTPRRSRSTSASGRGKSAS